MRSFGVDIAVCSFRFLALPRFLFHYNVSQAIVIGTIDNKNEEEMEMARNDELAEAVRKALGIDTRPAWYYAIPYFH